MVNSQGPSACLMNGFYGFKVVQGQTQLNIETLQGEICCLHSVMLPQQIEINFYNLLNTFTSDGSNIFLTSHKFSVVASTYKWNDLLTSTRKWEEKKLKGFNQGPRKHRRQWQRWRRRFFCNLKKKCYQPFFDASRYKNISATIRIGQDIRCLPYAEFKKKRKHDFSWNWEGGTGLGC